MKPLILFLLLFSQSVVQAKPLEVYVGVLPIQTFVKKIGGSHVNVHSLVQSGFDPHHFNPTPRQIEKLSEADLYVQSGIFFEKLWLNRIRAVNPAMQFLDIQDGLPLRQQVEDEHLHHGHDEHDTLDSHTWTSPQMVRIMLANIRDKLIELDALHAAEFQQNFISYSLEIEQLDQELEALFLPFKSRKFMVFHPAWGYFADRYNLEQVAIENQGKEPGARSMVRLVNQAQRDKIHIVLVQPQFDQKQAQKIAQSINAQVVYADPLAVNYIENMRSVAAEILKGFQP